MWYGGRVEGGKSLCMRLAICMHGLSVMMATGLSAGVQFLWPVLLSLDTPLQQARAMTVGMLLGSGPEQSASAICSIFFMVVGNLLGG